MDVLLITPDGVVENCICADSVARAVQFYPNHTCVERTNALSHVGPGHTYDAGTGTFAAPQEPPPPPAEPVSRVEFMRRFTDAERIAIRTSARGGNVIVEDALALLDGADRVHLDDADVGRFVRYLESIHLIADGRASVILGS